MEATTTDAHDQANMKDRENFLFYNSKKEVKKLVRKVNATTRRGG